MIDVNAQWREFKRAQVADAFTAVENRWRQIEEYDSGLTQAVLDAKLKADTESGKIEMIGPDRYRFTGGWDRNETFTVRRATRPEELPLVLPEHGLEETRNGVSLFTAQPAWHELGWVNGEATSDLDLVIKKGGLDFNVVHKPVYFFDDRGEIHEVPGKFATARDDTWAGLGVVGKIHKSVQPRESLGWLESLTGSGELLYESAGVLRGGAKTFVTVRLPDDVRIDKEGVNLEVRPYLALLDDHAGERQLWAVLTPWIVVCQNTHNFALRDAVTRWGVRHSINIHGKLEEARRELGLTVQGYEAFTAEEETLLHTGMTTAQFEDFLAQLYPRTDEDSSKNAITREAKRDDQLHEAWAFETSRLGGNRFAAEMALTGYWDNVVRSAAEGKGAVTRATALIEGEDRKKTAVHKQLLEVA